MSGELQVFFPGKKKVDVRVGEFLVKTDQSPLSGGDGSAPEPFDYFLVSLAACAGIYALNFCHRRGIDTKGISLVFKYDWNPEKKLVDKMEFVLTLPKGFPEKYRTAIIKSMQLCTVKRHLERYSEIEMNFKVIGNNDE